MPSSALSDAIKEAYACAPSNVVVLETIQLTHASIAEDIFLVRNKEDLTLTLEDASTQLFEGAGFRLSLPQSGDSGLQELSIGVDNVDRRISDFFNEAKNFQTPVECIYRPYLSNDLTQPQMDPPLVLYLSDVQITVFEVTAKASFADLINKKFPSESYIRSRFPSLGG